MGWENLPVPWQELERLLSWGNQPDLGPEPCEALEEPRWLPPAITSAATPWAELHCHSSYSFLDGASSPADLVDEAAARGLAALAITDHDGMYGIPQFAQAAVQSRPAIASQIR